MSSVRSDYAFEGEVTQCILTLYGAGVCVLATRMRTSPQTMPDHELNASMVNRIRVAKQLVRPATALV